MVEMHLKVPQQEEVDALRALLASNEIVPGLRRTVISGGAHIGAQTVVFAEHFASVHAFEPTAMTFAVLAENLGSVPNVHLHQCALLDERCEVRMRPPKPKSPWTSFFAVRRQGGDVEGFPLDAFAFTDVDLIKLDLEGAEVPALLGARATIERWLPFLIIEEFGHGGRYGYDDGDAQALLESWGYAKVWDAGPNLGFAYKGER